MPLATIAQEGSPSRRRHPTKTRGFSAECLGYVTVDWIDVPDRSGTVHRPSFAVFVATEHALRAFTANLRAGRKASLGEREHLEFLKSDGFRYTTQRFDQGSVLTVWQPALLLPAGELALEHVSLLCVPPRGAVAPGPAGRLAHVLPWLASRTTLPLPRDAAWLEVMAQGLTHVNAWDQHKVHHDEQLTAAGYDAPISLRLSHEQLDRVFKVETHRWHKARTRPAAAQPTRTPSTQEASATWPT